MRPLLRGTPWCLAVVLLAPTTACSYRSEACTSTPAPAAVAAPTTTRPVDQATLTDALLTESDLCGWKRHDMGDDDSGQLFAGGDGPGCARLNGLLGSNDRDAFVGAARTFEEVGGHGPLLYLRLLGYHANGAERVFGGLRDAFSTCRNLAIRAGDGHPDVPVTAAPIDGFPRLGDATLAIRLSGYANGNLIYYDLVFVRMGQVLSTTAVASGDPPDSERSKDVVPRQAERLASRLSG